jgi:hypothetical protein
MLALVCLGWLALTAVGKKYEIKAQRTDIHHSLRVLNTCMVNFRTGLSNPGCYTLSGITHIDHRYTHGAISVDDSLILESQGILGHPEQ